MDIGQVVLNGDGQHEAWVNWKGDVEVLLRYVSPVTDREIQKRAMKRKWVAHQQMEPEVDIVALRDYYCAEVIKGVRGLSRDGQPFEPTVDDLRRIWDGNHEFGMFVVTASRELDRFVQEKKV